MLVQVRSDGAPWIDVAGTPERAWQWVQAEHDLYEIYGDDLGAVEVRFIVSEQGDYEIIEAAIDDFVILTDLESVSSVEAGAGDISSTAFCNVNPNPFRSETTIQFSTTTNGPVHLTVHDVAGRLVATLVDGIALNAGVQSGVYYLKLHTGSFGARRQLLLFK
jgi:hypothetical protein